MTKTILIKGFMADAGTVNEYGDSFLNASKNFFNADEDMDTSDLADAGGDADLTAPQKLKFRQLIRSKKAEFKATGSGWRGRWKDFKKSSGKLKGLKEMAKAGIFTGSSTYGNKPAVTSSTEAGRSTMGTDAGAGKITPPEETAPAGGGFPSWAKWGLIGLGVVAVVTTGIIIVKKMRKKGK